VFFDKMMKTLCIALIVAVVVASLDVADAEAQKYVEFDKDLKFSVFSDTACDKAECAGRNIFKWQTFSGTTTPDTTCADWSCQGTVTDQTCSRECTPKVGDKFTETYKAPADAKWACEAYDCDAKTSCKRKCKKVTPEVKIECDKQASDNSLGCAIGRTVTETLNGTTVVRTKLAGVTVKLGRCSVTSDADGAFRICIQPGSATTEYAKTGYVGTSVRSTLEAGKDENVGDVLLQQVCDSKAKLTGRIRNAVNKSAVVGMIVTALPGVGSTTGSGGATATTDAEGQFTIDGLASGTYTLTGRKDGFEDVSVQAATICSKTTATPDLIAAPKLTSDQLMRAVLAWGKQPLDLDLHLVIKDIGGIGKNEVHSRVNWMDVGTSGAPYYAALDVDEMDGNGPETITVYKALPHEYRFYVHNYSLGPLITKSGATVTIYKFGTVGVWNKYTVPSTPCDEDKANPNCDEVDVCKCEYWDIMTWNGKTNQATSINKVQVKEPIPL
jgi:uncharacterized protein YfaP (DUF2135 family)